MGEWGNLWSNGAKVGNGANNEGMGQIMGEWGNYWGNGAGNGGMWLK